MVALVLNLGWTYGTDAQHAENGRYAIAAANTPASQTPTTPTPEGSVKLTPVPPDPRWQLLTFDQCRKTIPQSVRAKPTTGPVLTMIQRLTSSGLTWTPYESSAGDWSNRQLNYCGPKEDESNGRNLYGDKVDLGNGRAAIRASEDVSRFQLPPSTLENEILCGNATRPDRKAVRSGFMTSSQVWQSPQDLLYTRTGYPLGLATNFSSVYRWQDDNKIYIAFPSAASPADFKEHIADNSNFVLYIIDIGSKGLATHLTMYIEGSQSLLTSFGCTARATLESTLTPFGYRDPR